MRQGQYNITLLTAVQVVQVMVACPSQWPLVDACPSQGCFVRGCLSGLSKARLLVRGKDYLPEARLPVNGKLSTCPRLLVNGYLSKQRLHVQGYFAEGCLPKATCPSKDYLHKVDCQLVQGFFSSCPRLLVQATCQ